MARFLSFPLTFPLGGGSGTGGGTPGGLTTQVQYNNAGAFGGITGATTDGTTLTLSNLLTITQASANAGLITSTGYSLTGSDSTGMLNFSGTLNTSGNPVVLKIALTNTASGAATKFASFLAGASGTTEVFNVLKDGQTQISKNGGVGFSILVSGQNEVGIGRDSSVGGLAFFGDGTTAKMHFGGGNVNFTNGLKLDATSIFGWASSTISQNYDLILLRSAAATLQQGAANAASPVNQIYQSQGSRAATDNNVAGSSLTIRPGAGTGSVTPNALIFQSYVPVASGSGAQTATTTMTLNQGAVILPNSGGAATIGNAVLVAGTVTVNTTAATASAYIILTRKTSGGTLGTAITYTISAGTSFTITSDSALDTSTFTWLVLQGA